MFISLLKLYPLIIIILSTFVFSDGIHLEPTGGDTSNSETNNNTTSSKNNNIVFSNNNLSNNNNDSNKSDSHSIFKTIGKGLEKTGETLQNLNKERGDKLVNTTVKLLDNTGLGVSVGAGFQAGYKSSARQPAGKRLAIATISGIAFGSTRLALVAVNSINLASNSNPPSLTSNPPLPVENTFINSPLESELLTNPVETFLYSIFTLEICTLLLSLILLQLIISKYILSLDYKFNWLNKIFSETNASRIRTILFKIIKITSGIRTYNILMVTIMVIFCCLFNSYFLYEFISNIDNMITKYNEYKK